VDSIEAIPCSIPMHCNPQVHVHSIASGGLLATGASGTLGGVSQTFILLVTWTVEEGISAWRAR
jgi:hypothetical protein